MAAVQPRAAKLTLDETINAEWWKVYGGCDPAVDNNPRQYSRDWFSRGVHVGLRLGTEVGVQLGIDDATRAAQKQWELGHTTGCGYCAFAASQMNPPDDLSPEGMLGARAMQDEIVRVLAWARDNGVQGK